MPQRRGNVLGRGDLQGGHMGSLPGLTGFTVSLDDPLTVALLYSRVSTDEQAKEGVSLGDQDQTNRTYAARPNWIIGGEFQDVQSGTKPTRADYQRMLATARTLRLERKPVAVVVKFQDRLGRDM